MRHFSLFLSPDDFCVHFTDVRVGEELTFDYGEQYWYSRNIAPAGSWRALCFFSVWGVWESPSTFVLLFWMRLDEDESHA